MTFIYLFLAVAVYVVLLSRTRTRLPWPAAALFTAMVAAAIVLQLLYSVEGSNRAVQIAWTGIETRHSGDALTIGGTRQSATIGWPSGAFSPRISVKASDGQAGILEIRGGGGFVRYDGAIRNGVPLTADRPVQVDNYMLRASPLPWWPRRTVKLQIPDGAGQPIVEWDLRLPAQDRVVALASDTAFAVEMTRLRKRDSGTAGALERWASNIRILASRRGLRILTPGVDPVQTDVRFPARIDVLWPGRTELLRVERTADDHIDAAFLPPWRAASPLPPAEGSQPAPSVITVEATALPGDYAFLLPLGREIAPQSQSLPVQAGGAVKTLFLGDFALRFAISRDLPGRIRLLVLFSIALATFGAALWIASPRLLPRDGWTIGGIAVCAFVFLLIRTLLAFRYALDPAHIDSFAFNNVAAAMRALAIVPALVLLAARLRRDRTARYADRFEAIRRRTGQQLLALLAWLIAAGFLETWLSHGLWPNVSERFGTFHFGAGALLTTGLIGIILLWIVLSILYLYFYDPDREAGERLERILRRIALIVERPWVEQFAKDGAQILWRRAGATLDDEEPVEGRSRELAITLFVLIGGLAAVLFLLNAGLGLIAGSSEKLVQEIVAPFLIVWMPACLWLAARVHFKPGSLMARQRFWWIGWLALAVLLVFVPIVVFPAFVLRDAGGIVAACAFMWPVAGILFAGGRPWRLRWIPVLVLVVAVGVTSLVYLNLERMWLPGEARARLLIYKEGVGLQQRLPDLPMLREDAKQGVTVRQIRDGLQHIWENQAIAHEGGWWGLGFGRAPARRSNVPQHTLQADSTYSFFIASEEGFLGGLALLLLYAMPLVLVLRSARAQFDIGHGLATLIFCAFWLEALSHAAMNLALLPYTGRDLPLLTPGSTTDLLRWSLLFCLGVRAVLWRAMETEDGPEAFVTTSLISEPSAATPSGEPQGVYRLAVGCIISVPLLLLVGIAAQSWVTARDASLGHPLQWTRLLTAIRQAADTGKLHYDPKTREIVNDSAPEEIATLLDQEIARFNALTESEKLEGGGPHAAEFRQRFRGIRNPDDYEKLMNWLRTLDDEDVLSQRPALFRLVPDERFLDEEGHVLVANPTYEIRPNPAFNNSISFHELTKQEVPAVAFRDQAAGSYVLEGDHFQVHIPHRPAAGRELLHMVVLGEAGNGHFQRVADPGPDSADVFLRFRVKPLPRSAALVPFGEFRVDSRGLVFRPGIREIRLRSASGKLHRLQIQHAEVLAVGDRLELTARIGKDALQPSITIAENAHGALAGPAWVMGHWESVYDPDPALPWTANLAAALPAEQLRWKSELSSRFGTLTLTRALQSAAQEFATSHGRKHFEEFLSSRDGHTPPLPPRVAIAVMRVPTGEVLALGGWPRMSSSRLWEKADGEWIPPFEWVDDKAPGAIRHRYQADRNFDRMPVGSASKPLWASAILRVAPGIERKLYVRGGDSENDIFGVPISKKPWNAHPLPQWSGLQTYLTVSDNRYQVRLGFLGLARHDGSSPTGFAEGGHSNSEKESLDGGNSAWKKLPVFDEIDFTLDKPTVMRGLEQSALAKDLRDTFGIGAETGEVVHRRSFWTGKEEDDWKPLDSAPLSLPLEYTSPEAANLEFNRVRNPRYYVAMLLGGATNLWSNVDLAGAFATCVLGRAVVPHITLLDPRLIQPTEKRREKFQNPAVFYNGLRGVIDSHDGTANPYLGKDAIGFLNSLRGVQHYAKTGTLAASEEKAHSTNNISRILLVLVRDDNSQGGLAISIAVENTGMGTATKWLGEFLTSNEDEIRRWVYQR